MESKQGNMPSNLGEKVTLILLAGGYSRRFNYKIKGLQQIENQSLIERQIKKFLKDGYKTVISVSSREIRKKYENVLQGRDIDLSHITFYEDVVYDQGPMKAILDIIPKINTKLALVVGVDNVFIKKDDGIRLIEEINSPNRSDLVTVSINNQRLVSSFFCFKVPVINNLILSIPESQKFDRLTDLFRIVNKISLYFIEKEGQFVNVNTPEQLNNISTQSIIPTTLNRILILKPKYYLKYGKDCSAFQNELRSWSTYGPILHIRDNILREAKRILGDSFKDCDII